MIEPGVTPHRRRVLGALLLLPLLAAGCMAPDFLQAYQKMEAMEPDYRLADSGGDSLPVLDEAAGLTEYLTYAAINNHGLRAAFYRWKGSLERVPQVTALDDPVFSYTNFIESVETRTGPQENAFSLGQKFPFFGKLSTRGDLAMAEANATYEALQAKLLKVSYGVKAAYYEYYYLVQAIRLTEENHALLTRLEKIAASRFRNKLASQQDLLRAQTELGRIANDLISLKDLEPAVAAKLNALLNRPEDAPLARPRVAPPLKPLPKRADLVAWAVQNSPALKELDHRIEQARQKGKLATLNRFPDLTLMGKVIDTDRALMPGTKDSGRDPILAQFSVNVPLHLGKLRAAEKEAEAEQRRAKGRRVQTEHNLRAELKMVSYRLRDARRQAELFRDNLIPKARQMMQVSEADYKSGKSDFLSLVDSERVLLRFQLSYYRALSNYHQRRAELEMIVGAPLEQAEPNR